MDTVVVKEDCERNRWVKKMEGGEGTVLASLRLPGDRMKRFEGIVKGVGKGVWRAGNRKEYERNEERLRKLRREEEEAEMEEEASEEEVEGVSGQFAPLAKQFVFELMRKKVDFGGGPLRPRGDNMFSCG